MRPTRIRASPSCLRESSLSTDEEDITDFVQQAQEAAGLAAHGVAMVDLWGFE